MEHNPRTFALPQRCIISLYSATAILLHSARSGRSSAGDKDTRRVGAAPTQCGGLRGASLEGTISTSYANSSTKYEAVQNSRLPYVRSRQDATRARARRRVLRSKHRVHRHTAPCFVVRVCVCRCSITAVGVTTVISTNTTTATTTIAWSSSTYGLHDQATSARKRPVYQCPMRATVLYDVPSGASRVPPPQERRVWRTPPSWTVDGVHF